ncbi:MAG TPA: hypothetical protein VNO32_66000 [Candidatus Acidoferrum sp.]|nr:hypothetical protein [Candidatus Acidoferrum sp.]
MDDAIGDAQTAILALYATVSVMPAPVPPTDNVQTVPNIQAVVQNAVQVIANVVADE